LVSINDHFMVIL